MISNGSAAVARPQSRVPDRDSVRLDLQTEVGRGQIRAARDADDEVALLLADAIEMFSAFAREKTPAFVDD